MQQVRGDLDIFHSKATLFHFAEISVNSINPFYTLGCLEITVIHKFCDRTRNMSYQHFLKYMPSPAVFSQVLLFLLVTDDHYLFFQSL